MKNFIFTLILFSLFSIGHSQDTLLRSKKGTPILPQAGDWAIGIDATPFFQIFNSTSNVGFNFIRDNLIIGKKFITPSLAYRGKLRIGFNSVTDDEYVIKDGQTVPDPTVTVTDSKITNFTDITVGFGIEKRLGYGRLQAFYGPELLLSYASYSVSYSYGNEFSMSNPDPTSYNFGQNIPGDGQRVTYFENGPGFTVAVRAFLGVEYFFAPKISIGGEFGWGVAYNNVSDGKRNVQSWDAANNSVKTDTEKLGGGSQFTLDNDNFGGAIYLLFHF